jgi:hypothetical protein
MSGGQGCDEGRAGGGGGGMKSGLEMRERSGVGGRFQADILLETEQQ